MADHKRLLALLTQLPMEGNPPPALSAATSMRKGEGTHLAGWLLPQIHDGLYEWNSNNLRKWDCCLRRLCKSKILLAGWRRRLLRRETPKTNKAVLVNCVGEHPTSAKQVGVLHELPMRLTIASLNISWASCKMPGILSA